MNLKRFFLAAAAASVVYAGLQYIGPNVYLHAEYEEAKHLWRPEGEVILPLVLVSNAIYGVVFAFIFVKGYQGLGIKEGLRFGIYVTWLAVVPNVLYQYATQPIPSMLVAKWVALGLGENMALGAVVALLYGDHSQEKE